MFDILKIYFGFVEIIEQYIAFNKTSWVQFIFVVLMLFGSICRQFIFNIGSYIYINADIHILLQHNETLVYEFAPTALISESNHFLVDNFIYIRLW